MSASDGDPRKLRYVFFPLASVGIIVALGLGVREVQDEADFDVSDSRVQREGLVATVQVNVTNQTDVTRCPIVEVAARSRGGLDIDRLAGEPVSGDGQVNPGQTVGFRAVFTEMTEDDYDRLDDFVGFVSSDLEC